MLGANLSNVPAFHVSFFELTKVQVGWLGHESFFTKFTIIPPMSDVVDHLFAVRMCP